MGYAQGLILLLLVASMLALSLAQTNGSANQGSTTIVGGSQGWRFGYNYADWAFQNGPFYINNILVFKYDPPSNTTFPHSVYLFPNYSSFEQCDLKKAKLIGKPTKGSGQGFRFVLKKQKPYFFACGERDGLHCKTGLMKFIAMPVRPCRG